MKRTVLLAAFLMLSLLLFQCKKDTPKAEPVVTLTAASNITATSASAGGTVTADGGAAVTVRGVCWSSTNTTPTTSDSKTSDATGTGTFTSAITGLMPGTTYNLRAYATNSVGTSYSPVSTFKTLSSAPTVTTLLEISLASFDTPLSYSSGGDITTDGGSRITDRGVCWGTTTGPTIANSKTSDGRGPGTFISAITGLAFNTQYYLRAYATNSVGTAYGNEISFKSLSSVTTVAGGNGQGSDANSLYKPISLFVDASGNIYVADYGSHRIQKWAPGATSGTTVAGGNGQGSAANQFSRPLVGVSVDASGNIYVADQSNNRIQKWAPGATSGTTVVGVLIPMAMFVDASGNIYVSDAGNNRIQKWAPGATSGTTVAGGNGQGSAANQLDSPQGVFVDASGNIYVSDHNNHRIQKWAPGATSGTTVAGGNGYGSAANQLKESYGVFVDASGNIYVADTFNYRIQKWAPGATSGTTVAGGNGQGSATFQLNDPRGLFVDPSGNIYVADYGNDRIQKWAKP
jgi:hypothetical protein